MENRQLVFKATTTDNNPPPGYLYGEISRATIASYETCKTIQKLLLDRLKNSNHNVKWKALLVIKHICRSGRNDFKKDMARQTELIRDCLGFRGAPDPLLGDTIYKRVQEAAKEALDAIYDSEISSQGNQSGLSSRIEGFGTTPIQPPESNTNNYSDPSKLVSSVVSGVNKFVRKNVTQDNSNNFHGNNSSSYGASNTGNYNPNFQESYGNNNGNGYNGNYGNNSRMQGFGNPAFQDVKFQKTSMVDQLKEKASSVAKYVSNATTSAPIQPTFAAPLPSSSGNSYGNGPNQYQNNYSGQNSFSPNQNTGYNDYSYATNRGPTANQWQNSASQTVPPPPPPSTSTINEESSYSQAKSNVAFQWSSSSGESSQRQVGKVGGVWNKTSSSSKASTSGPRTSMNAIPQSLINQPQSNMNTINGGVSAPSSSSGAGHSDSSGEYEKTLIQDLCAGGGIRATVPKEKLESFIQLAKTLDIELVGGLLLDELDDTSNPQIPAKVLAVIDELTLRGGSQWKEYFIDNYQEIEDLVNKKNIKAITRDKGIKVLKRLGKADSINTNNQTVQNNVQPKRAPSTGIVEDQDDLLGFDKFTESNETTTVNNTESLYITKDNDGFKQQSNNGDDLFNSLTISSPGQNTPSQQQSTHSATSISIDKTVDLFGGLEISNGTPETISQDINNDKVDQKQFLTQEETGSDVSGSTIHNFLQSKSDLKDNLDSSTGNHVKTEEGEINLMELQDSPVRDPLKLLDPYSSTNNKDLTNSNISNNSNNNTLTSDGLANPNLMNGMNPNLFLNMTPMQVQMMQYQMMQQQMMMGNYNAQFQGMPQQNGGLAPSMMNPLQPRATIPETSGANNSSFNFISKGSNSAQMNNLNSSLSLSGSISNQGGGESEDAFGFVREAMKGK